MEIITVENEQIKLTRVLLDTKYFFVGHEFD